MAEEAGAVGEDLLVQGDGLGKTPRRAVCCRKVVADGEGVGVVFA